MGLLKHCEDAKNDNYKFQYAYIMDGEGRLKHILWSSSICFDSYKKYGVIVVFGTTWKVNAYTMPFGISVGFNNHRL